MTVAYMLDTNVIIHLRDRDVSVTERVAALPGAVIMSVISRVEVEGGIARNPALAAVRRERLDMILAAIPAVAFDDESAAAYARIVAACGYSRRKLLDRMIAAQALVHRAAVVTMNPEDFNDVPGLELLAW